MKGTSIGANLIGGLLFGILEGWPLRELGQFASAVAALGSLTFGSRMGLPDLGQVRAFLKKHGVADHPVLATG